jgi:hypothetical protein
MRVHGFFESDLPSREPAQKRAFPYKKGCVLGLALAPRYLSTDWTKIFFVPLLALGLARAGRR